MWWPPTGQDGTVPLPFAPQPAARGGDSKPRKALGVGLGF